MLTALALSPYFQAVGTSASKSESGRDLRARERIIVQDTTAT